MVNPQTAGFVKEISEFIQAREQLMNDLVSLLNHFVPI